ncbi:hypothetical protein CVT25_015176, partial [Psilocybe cyanescens]
MDTSSDHPPASVPKAANADLEAQKGTTSQPRNDLHANVPNTADADLEAQISTTSRCPNVLQALPYMPYRRPTSSKRSTAQSTDVSGLPPSIIQSIQKEKEHPQSGGVGRHRRPNDGPLPSTGHGHASAQPPQSTGVTAPPPSNGRASAQNSQSTGVTTLPPSAQPPQSTGVTAPPPSNGRASA